MSNKEYKMNNTNNNYQNNAPKKMSKCNNFISNQTNKLNILSNKCAIKTNPNRKFLNKFKIYKIKFCKKNKK